MSSVALLVSCGRVGYELDAEGRNASATESGGTFAAVAGFGGASAGGVPNTAVGGSGAAGGAGSLAGCTLESASGRTRYAPGEIADLGGFHVLRAGRSDQCVQVAGCVRTIDGAHEQASCGYQACQVFESVERAPGWFSFQNLVSGYCLDAGGMLQSAATVDYTCFPRGHADADRQSWQLVCEGEDAWRITNRRTGTVLAAAVGARDGATVVHAAFTGGDQQRWLIESRPSVFDATVPTSEAEPGILWRYSTGRASRNWERRVFDDSQWSEGRAGFGRGDGLSAWSRTPWVESEIWLRRSFSLSELPATLELRVYHDLTAEVYINGIEAAVLGDWSSGYKIVPISQAALDGLVIGENSIAAHCTNDMFGEQYFDLGLGQFAWR